LKPEDAQSTECRESDEVSRARPDGGDQQPHPVQDEYQAKARVDDEEHMAVQDRPRDALDDAAEVFGRIRAGMIRRDGDEEVDRHPEQELDQEEDLDGEELVAQPLAAGLTHAPVA